MNAVNRTARPDRLNLMGNIAVGSVLAALAVMLFHWQSGVFAIQGAGSTRILWAIGSSLAYVASCAVFFLVRRSRAHEAIAKRVIVKTEPGAETILVVYASQTGHAEYLAEQTAESLHRGGAHADVRSIAQVDPAMLRAARQVLFVVSTTGEGDAPDMAAGFVNNVMGSGLKFGDLRYGLLALGDSDYTSFCGFGLTFEAWLRDAGAHALFDMIQVDNGDPGALRHWQYHLGQLSGRSDLPDWQVPEYSIWRLAERRVLNPGSVGDPCFHIALLPVNGEQSHWQAGDIVEIGPQHAPADVETWLDSTGLDGGAIVLVDGQRVRLSDIVTRSSLDTSISSKDAQQVAESLARLPHRDYSIASIPEDGRIELLLRQWRRSDGSLGLGTGWLTEYAEPGAEISLRIRKNNAFHVPVEDCPLLLIGNGTGIASLRALLKQREVENRHRNWLVFGERNSDRDFHYRDEIVAWEKRGVIERLDLAFSRDQTEREYVQHRLEAAAEPIREWVRQGAVILVCGSLEGMAPGVDAALRRILGDEQVQQLIASGRYRRDVY